MEWLNEINTQQHVVNTAGLEFYQQLGLLLIYTMFIKVTLNLYMNFSLISSTVGMDTLIVLHDVMTKSHIIQQTLSAVEDWVIIQPAVEPVQAFLPIVKECSAWTDSNIRLLHNIINRALEAGDPENIIPGCRTALDCMKSSHERFRDLIPELEAIIDGYARGVISDPDITPPDSFYSGSDSE